MTKEQYHQVKEQFIVASTRSYESAENRLRALSDFYHSLPEINRALLERVIVEEFFPKEELRTDCILLAGRLQLRSAEKSLTDVVLSDAERRPFAILSLGELEAKKQYNTIQQYLQQCPHQALQALARIDFQRTLPNLHQTLKNASAGDHSSFNTISCILLNALDSKKEDYFLQCVSALTLPRGQRGETLLRAVAKARDLYEKE